jgi:hypothetical protein
LITKHIVYFGHAGKVGVMRFRPMTSWDALFLSPPAVFHLKGWRDLVFVDGSLAHKN